MSGQLSASGSPNIVVASENATSCLASFRRLFSGSHSNFIESRVYLGGNQRSEGPA